MTRSWLAMRPPFSAVCGALLSLLGVTSIAPGCAGREQPVQPASAQQAPVAPLHRGPLTDYVAAAGLRWLIIGRPKELADNPAFVESLSPLFSQKRLQAFTQTTGVDLRETPSALAAGFDFGTLYMAETPRQNARVQALFTERLLHGANVQRPHPDLHRVSGTIGTTPQMLVRIDQKLIAVAVGDPTPARVVEAFARRRLSRSPPALRGSALAALPVALESEPLSLYAPGPFAREWETAARGLLGGATAVAAGVRPIGGQSLRVTLYMAGAWGEVPDAASRMAGAWEDLAQSALGRLLGLGSVRSGPAIETTPELLSAQVELDLAPLVRGLHTAVAGDTWEILDLPRPSGVKSPLPRETGPNAADRGTSDAGLEADPDQKR
jgi:hypothetical protein